VRAATYRAVSVDAQAVSGLALDAQEEELEAAVEARRWTLVAPLIDGVTSVELAPADRLALSEALTILRNHKADVVHRGRDRRYSGFYGRSSSTRGAPDAAGPPARRRAVAVLSDPSAY
jgi:hypothetical protein